MRGSKLITAETFQWPHAFNSHKKTSILGPATADAQDQSEHSTGEKTMNHISIIARTFQLLIIVTIIGVAVGVRAQTPSPTPTPTPQPSPLPVSNAKPEDVATMD